MKAPGMSTVATFRISIAPITHDTKNISNENVGADDYSLDIYAPCGRPYTHNLALIIPHHFFFTNIKY